MRCRKSQHRVRAGDFSLWCVPGVSRAISSNLKLQEKICLAFGKTAESRPPCKLEHLLNCYKKFKFNVKRGSCPVCRMAKDSFGEEEHVATILALISELAFMSCMHFLHWLTGKLYKMDWNMVKCMKWSWAELFSKRKIAQILLFTYFFGDLTKTFLWQFT